ncbi:HutD family protein [Streptomyces sp. NPDC050704]|uniref:HutD/Ves family protein n=1 Tax=Streptomyces sp. NPDC050704 TaxID=3157219 RepID=UPI00341C0AB6
MRAVRAGVRLLPAAGRVAVPWKNGGGVTREIAAWPPGDGMGVGMGVGMDDFTWRVSLAEVAADGPFSAFPEVDRTLTLVEGAGMDLTVGGERRLVDERFVPQDFRGDVPTDCRLLDGPVVNLNVMWRRGERTTPNVAVVRGRLPLAAPGTAPEAGPAALLVVALDGTAEVAGARLGPYDAVLLTGEWGAEGAAESRVTGRAALVGLPAPA